MNGVCKREMGKSGDRFVGPGDADSTRECLQMESGTVKVVFPLLINVDVLTMGDLLKGTDDGTSLWGSLDITSSTDKR